MKLKAFFFLSVLHFSLLHTGNHCLTLEWRDPKSNERRTKQSLFSMPPINQKFVPQLPKDALITISYRSFNSTLPASQVTPEMITRCIQTTNDYFKTENDEEDLNKKYHNWIAFKWFYNTRLHVFFVAPKKEMIDKFITTILSQNALSAAQIFLQYQGKEVRTKNCKLTAQEVLNQFNLDN